SASILDLVAAIQEGDIYYASRFRFLCILSSSLTFITPFYASLPFPSLSTPKNLWKKISKQTDLI
ncbi:hypothetical protein MKW98_009359, partial [Papaver atlanticum]